MLYPCVNLCMCVAVKGWPWQSCFFFPSVWFSSRRESMDLASFLWTSLKGRAEGHMLFGLAVRENISEFIFSLFTLPWILDKIFCFSSLIEHISITNQLKIMNKTVPSHSYKGNIS